MASRLATWEDVLAHLAAAHGEIKVLDDARVELVQVGLLVRRLGGDESPWLELLAVLGTPRHVPIAATLGTNATAAIGAFCLIDGELGLRQLLPINGLRHQDLDEALWAMAFQAREGRKRLGAG